MKPLITFIMLVLALSSCREEASQHSSKSIWKPYSKEALQYAVQHQKPVVIDFSAQWCPNCHELDDVVFSRPEIQDKLAGVVALRMDATDQDDPKIQDILQQYQIEGVPTIVFLDKHGAEVKDARVIGLVSPQEFSQAFAMLNLLK
jgi:thiol:disulfide interchange protein DsbD